jgi:isopropylmalate/homocitrate/citramalate synthase
MTTTIHEQAADPAQQFHRIWEANFIDSEHPAFLAADTALSKQIANPEPKKSTVSFTDVTLRDGEQQRTNDVTIEDRVSVFDNIVSTGVNRIEIGHLGNSNGDQQLARAIVAHIAKKEKTGETDQYEGVQLQVLFGSQEDIMQQGIAILSEAFESAYGEKWQQIMAEKVVVHVYDRIDENLRNTASATYTIEESAERVCNAAQYAINSGFKHLSISGEAATAVSPTTAAQFYRSINQYLFSKGAVTVNDNLANTYGFSGDDIWNAYTMSQFNDIVKYGFDGKVTTSIHPHDDVGNATGFSMQAIVAGFDRVEGTHIGMGERAGNVASVNIIARILEQSRQRAINEEKPKHDAITRSAGRFALKRTIAIDERITKRLGNWYTVGEELSKIYGEHAMNRWHRTALGNPYAFDNGSGPHDQAMAIGIKDPINHPVYKNYEWFLTVAAIMGREIAGRLATGEPAAVREVTVNNHAGGGKTNQIVSGNVTRSPEVAAEAARNFRAFTRHVIELSQDGVTLAV